MEIQNYGQQTSFFQFFLNVYSDGAFGCTCKVDSVPDQTTDVRWPQRTAVIEHGSTGLPKHEVGPLSPN